MMAWYPINVVAVLAQLVTSPDLVVASFNSGPTFATPSTCGPKLRVGFTHQVASRRLCVVSRWGTRTRYAPGGNLRGVLWGQIYRRQTSSPYLSLWQHAGDGIAIPAGCLSAAKTALSTHA